MDSTRHAIRSLIFAIALAIARSAAAEPPDAFSTGLAHDFFQDRQIVESAEFVALDAPVNAADAALVPVTMAIRAPQGDARRVVKMTLIIDNNPVPLAGAFTLGEKAGLVQIATRVRVNSDTYLHLVAELSDGALVASKRYVHAAGGCSAPATKAVDGAAARLGQLKFRMLPDIVHGRREAVVMIRHPNFTGMQMDESTHDYTPARYVDHFAVYQGENLIFALDGGIAISEDPNFRFAFRVDENQTIRVEAADIAGGRFSSAWDIIGGGG